jgi:hypothetical protein
MSDDREYLQKTRDLAGHITGESPEEVDARMPGNFALYSLRKRSAILDAWDASTSKGEMDEEDIPGALEKAELRQRLGEIHHKLRLAGR